MPLPAFERQSGSSEGANRDKHCYLGTVKSIAECDKISALPDL